MRIHFIAIGGAAMHNLALALHSKGYNVTGSDDEINEPSKSRLARVGLLPAEMGWFPEKITADIDAIILGMHARIDNPELVKAKELGLKIFSYPEYLYEQSKDKRRVVIGGSHGKTSITAMILHVLSACNRQFDYMVGSQLEGFDTMVRLSHDAPVIILEGDEYLSSPIDRRPKFHLYHADVALLSGIAWDHINVFPTFDNYVEQFRIFVRQLPSNGTLVYCENDEEVVNVSKETNDTVKKLPYAVPSHEIRDGITYLKTDSGEVSLMVFGKHNLMNIEGARNICKEIGLSDEQFYKAISTFKGAARRLELVSRSNDRIVYKDFAHSPSKLKATIAAVKEQFTNRRLVACMELHTFSSLNAAFLDEYANSMDLADEAIVYFNAHTIEHKKLPPISVEQVRKSFAREDIIVIDTTEALKNHLHSIPKNGDVMLMMSSGTFDGLDLKTI
jgi:UDP-N-acetylmuramate: L-alanyl-gamma-D-glutamyl-meso-diaminopimelate ligase